MQQCTCAPRPTPTIPTKPPPPRSSLLNPHCSQPRGRTHARAHTRPPALRAQAASLLSTFDLDGSGLMELAEFANLVAALRQGAAAAAAVPDVRAYQMQMQQMQQQAEGDVRAAFMSFDRNGSGTPSRPVV